MNAEPVKLPHPTTRTSHWQKVAELRQGQYFKMHGRWYLAAGDVVDNRAQSDGFDWVVKATDTDGKTGRRSIHEYVEVNNDGTVPSSFQPATLRRQAAKLRDKAAELERQAAFKVRLAALLDDREA